MPASNTLDCFREFIGKKVIGLLHGALPVGRADLAAGTKTLVFEDGRGLTIASNGSYWIESAEDIARATDQMRRRLAALQKDTSELVKLAGALP